MVARQTLDLLVGVQILPGEIAKSLCSKELDAELPTQWALIMFYSWRGFNTQEIATRRSLWGGY